MKPLTGCGENLVVLIETTDKNWSFFYSIVKSVKISMSNKPHGHPIPYGTEITDHVKREMDQITITGVIGCLNCTGENHNINNYIPSVKRLKERMMHCRDEFVTLTSNHWQARYMILTNVEIEENQDHVQTKNITTTWIGANYTGTIRNPDFQRGGIVI
jgi:hypothetical protein